MNNSMQIVMMPTAKLYHHPDNPREEYTDIEEMADSMKSMGILQNLTVVRYDPVYHSAANVADPNDAFIVIIGNRRLEGALMAKIPEVPCVISNMDIVTQLATMDVENNQRKDTSLLKQAKNYQTMLDLGESVESIASRTGFSTTTVRNRIKLLDLQEDKFAKAEARGATMSDYLQLNKIASTELRNKVLEAVGTKNFTNELQRAITLEKNQKLLNDNIAIVSTFATKVDSVEGIENIKQVYMYAFWHPVKVEVPADATTEKYYYRTTGDSLYLYVKHVPTQAELDAKTKDDAILEKANQRKAERKELEKRFFALRKAFVKDISFAQAKKHIADIVTLQGEAVKRLAKATYHVDRIRAIPDLPALYALLNKEGDESGMDMELYMEAVNECPAYALLCLSYSMTDKVEHTYFHDYWDSEKRMWLCAYSPNDTLDGLYDFLTIFGYQMSDEELAFQNGIHSLFDKEEESAETPQTAA